MKFREQLNILLWKNWKTKIRSPVLTVMEIVLPLVLIAILAILRNTVPTEPKETDYGEAMPLPTAGLIPLAQMFCDGGNVDQDHFKGQPGSILDVSLFLVNGFTKLIDGDWPPREDPGPETDTDFDFKLYIENAFKQKAKGEKPDFRPLWFNNKRKILQTLSQEDKFIQKDPRLVSELFAKLAELKSARDKADEFILSQGRAATSSNSTLPQECRRFVLPNPNPNAQDTRGGVQDDEEEDDKLDYWEILVVIWRSLEVAVCQSPRPWPANDQLSSFNTGIPGLPANLSVVDIIRNALMNNPRILYSPKGTEADKIIDNIFGVFQFLDELTYVSEGWLQLSEIIREELNFTIHGERLDPNFMEWLAEVQGAYEEVTETVTETVTDNIVTEGPDRPITFPPFPTLPPGTVRGWVEAALDGVDYLACSWLSIAQLDLDMLNLFEGFSSEEEMVKYFLEGAKEDQVTVIASLAFEVDENGTLPDHMTYKIRQNATISQVTTRVQNLLWSPASDFRGLIYIVNGFVFLQDIVERSMIDLKVGKEVTEPGIYMQEFPKPCYIEDGVKLVLVEHMFPLVMVFSNVFTVALLARNIVYEKEHRLKEIMKLMGLEATVHWTAWFITALIQVGITMTLMTILITLTNVLSFTDGFLLWMLFIVFGINTILFAFFMSTLFNDAKVASASAGIFYLLTYVPYMIISIMETGGVTVPVAVKIVFSFFTTTGMGLSGRYFNFFETIGQGVQFDNFLMSLSITDEYDLFVATMMSIMSTFTYIIFIWYIDNAFPGEFGIPRPWYFPFTITYWFGTAAVEDTEEGCHNRLPTWIKKLLVSLGCLSMSRMVEDLLKQTAKTAEERDSRYFEDESSDLPVAVQIQNMTKVFSNGKLAVDDLSITMLEGQILSFLGHNGAGKTTTMSMLTGMIPPSGGTALIYGQDIRHEMGKIRKNLGMCPQHNVLFDSLTVEEHMKFYARLKGTAKHSLDLEVESMLDDTGLKEKRFNTIDALSGGMKRKLCIGIAFISGSQTVILDEPTAGVDPWSRREIWDLVLKYKEDRTIMLSTHHMDEADILGDTIAVISHGSLKCKGSSLFLKSTFGEGYHLVAAKKITPLPELEQRRGSSVSQAGSDRDRSPSLTSALGDDRERSPSVQSDMSVFESDPVPVNTRCSERNVTLFVQSMVSNAYLKSETPRELHYIIPYAAIKNGRASDLFHALDKSLAGLELDSYGVTDTSLEEVFLRVTAYAKSRPTGETLGDMQLGPPPPVLRVPSDDVSIATESSMPSPRLHRFHSLPTRRTSIDIADNADPMGDLLKFQQQIDLAIEKGDMESLVVQDSDGRTYTPENFRKNGRSHSATPTPIMSKRRQSSFTAGSNPRRLRRSTSDTVNGVVTTTNGNLSNHDQRNITDSTSTLYDSDFIISQEAESSGAAGSYVVTGFRLYWNQFTTCLLKRFYFTVRNWKALVSQIVLPVLFVAIAMVIGIIEGPVQREVPLELSTAMFFNETKAMGEHFVPFSDRGSYDWSYDAPPLALMDTFKLPSGIGSTCVIDTAEWNANGTYHYSDTCQKVLWKDGKPIHPWTLDRYHPRPPTTSVNNGLNFLQLLDEIDSDVKYNPVCQCTSDNRMMVCNEDRDVKEPPYFKVITQDVLQNITGVNESTYFYATTDEYRSSRFGATTFGHIRSQVPYWLTRLPLILKQMFKARVAKAWYDSRGWHSVPTFINVVNNAILRANLPPEKENPAAYGITVIHHPMNGTTPLNAVGSLIAGSEFIIAVMVVVGFSFIPAGFILFLVQERSSQAKHLQFVSGLNPLLYWVSSLLWDMLVYLIPVAFCAGVLQIFRIPAFTDGVNYGATLLLILVFGWACTPTMYPASFVFKDSSAAYVTLAVINITLGVSLLFVTFLLDYFTETNQEDLRGISESLKRVFIIFPTFALGRGLMDMVFTSTANELNELVGLDEYKSPFDWNVTGLNLTAMVCVGFGCYVLTILIEYNFFISPRVMPVEEITPVGKEDPDVAMERQRVLKGRAKRDMVRLSNLTKIYNTAKMGKHIAVHRLCLGIPKGECFGMLGVNGAGKTTTFKMLTGDHNPSGGDAFICGKSILKDQNKVRQNMGYCPQFDALFDELSARQHLSLYARLRGIPTNEIDGVVEWALEKLELQMYADKSARTYSGGNKRKLSTAIALLGNPPVVFLDEPTAGMDPYAKRFLWDLILDLVDEGKCIILTSHSMEECETLCGRLAIMVQGRFRCLGSVQQLKSRYGDGYSAKVTVPGPDFDSDMRDLILFMNRNFPTATIKERHYNLIEYEFRPEKESLSAVFRGLEKAKSKQLVEDYSISQNTLDNVFINFVKEQQENYETRVGPVALNRRQRPKSSAVFDLDGLSTPLLTEQNECQNNFVSNDLNIDELDELGTEIHLYTPV